MMDPSAASTPGSSLSGTAGASSCPLCGDGDGDGDALVLWRNAKLRVIAVDDVDYPGYTRVIWNRHIAEMTDLDESDRLHVMEVVFEVERAQRLTLWPDKVNVASFGNMVPHLHWHIIARWHGDRHFPDPVWALPRVPAGSESREFLDRRAKSTERVAAYHHHLQLQLSARFPAA